MNRLDELNLEIVSLKDQLSAKLKERALLLCPFVVGDAIESLGHFQKGKYRVVWTGVGQFERFAVHAVRIKKDGSDGAKVVIHFPEDFRKVQP